NFKIELNPYVYEYSTIDATNDMINLGGPNNDYFKLVDFSAKYDPVPTMLNQDHTALVRGFMGQTSAFKKEYIKKNITILAMNEGTDIVKYIHGNYGRGTFTFYAGHDPEDYQHAVGDPPTDLDLFKNSPGYRLILNNVLFPAAKKKKLKT
ncbi:MAG: asparagine synthetase B, partial [Ignavibacteria bacterium]|nr:asparagine synthetase B [Ignavibacteria bacterium]